MLRRAAFLLLLSAACATAPQPAGAAKEFDLEAHLARELPAPLPKHKVAPPGGTFRGQTEAAGKLVYEPSEGVTLVKIPLGTGSELQCFVYQQAVDSGSVLSNVINAVAGELEVQAVRPTDVVALKDVPAIFLELAYLAPMEGGKAFGQMKLMMYPDNATPMLCMHDEPGYSQSFKRIASDLARSLESTAEEAPAAPRYTDVQAVRLNDMPIGFEWRALYDGEGGTTLSETITAMFMPRSPTELVVHDTTLRELTDKSGQLLEVQYAKVENGKLSLRMSLARDKSGKYLYKGEHSGKPLEGTFAAPKAGLFTDLTIAPQLKARLLGGRERELSFAQYSPSLNPAAPVDVTCLKAESGPRDVQLSLGGMKVEATLDAQGFAERITMPVGSAKLVQQRIHNRGKP